MIPGAVGSEKIIGFSSAQERQARPLVVGCSAETGSDAGKVFEGFVERLFLAPTLVASAIVLMRFAFRIGNHFGSLPLPLTIFRDMTQISVEPVLIRGASLRSSPSRRRSPRSGALARARCRTRRRDPR